ncbi:MAG: sigma-70 family RNA polymerase sigma factor [Porphyrobacter sp.]|nr:sigma-70 family RNA polymerase sigma factor [Porphyrobacter sp.]
MALAGSRDRGEDLLQSTLERALEKQALFTPGTRLDHWLYRIARNLLIDDLRKTGSRGGNADGQVEPDQLAGSDGNSILEARSELSRASEALAALSLEYREVFVLVVIEGHAYREAAELLDVPIGTVMSRIARARALIAQSVGRGDEDD